MENQETTTQQPELDVWGGTTSEPVVQETTTETTTETPLSTETTTPVVPAEEVKTEPVVQEKIVEVEKIVEKYPEFKDEYSKQLFEALQQGKENELFDYLSRKNKDYSVISDVDVVKEKLKIDNPQWTDKDIQIELKHKFGAFQTKKDLDAIDKDLDPELYEKAVAFNEAIEEKELLLSREARDARIALEETKKNIEFPKISQEEKTVETPLTQEEVDEQNRLWAEHVEKEMGGLSDFTFKVGDEEVSYKITDEDKASQKEYMKSFNGLKVAQDLGWVDAEGKENVVKIAEDMLKLQNFSKIIASAATQMKTTAKKEVVAEIKNVDLNPQQTSPTGVPDLGAQIWS